jgi:hypothetical protein
VKRLMAKITKRTKENNDGTVSTIWDVQVGGSAVVRVYLTPIGDRQFFTISYWADGKRKRQLFPSYEKAVEAAKQAGEQLAKGDLGSADLSATERVACRRAMNLLAPTGVPIEVAAGQFAEAFAKLKGRASLSVSLCVAFEFVTGPSHPLCRGLWRRARCRACASHRWRHRPRPRDAG